jgi:hypothetical protein
MDDAWMDGWMDDAWIEEGTWVRKQHYTQKKDDCF